MEFLNFERPLMAEETVSYKSNPGIISDFRMA